MAMTMFTEAFKKAKDVFKNQTFEKDWEKALKTDWSVKALMGDTGLNTTHAASCDKLRKKIDDGRPDGLFMRLFNGEGQVIWDAAGDAAGGSRAERAGAIKFLRHVYRAQKRGAQDVWIFNPPKAHKKFIFDELKGGAASCKSKLSSKAEMFTDVEMKHMCAALSIALAAANKTNAKLAAPDDTVKQKIKDWFCDDHSSDTQYNKALTTLKAGVPKVVAACNSNTLVFADDPTSRRSRKSTYGLAVRGGEKGGFPVIYLEGAFTRMTGNSGKMWLCAETIIHELTHTELSTEDHFYDSDGLKPTSNAFAQAKALTNADSWGYFCIDVDGKLTDSDKQRILVAPS